MLCACKANLGAYIALSLPLTAQQNTANIFAAMYTRLGNPNARPSFSVSL